MKLIGSNDWKCCLGPGFWESTRPHTRDLRNQVVPPSRSQSFNRFLCTVMPRYNHAKKWKPDQSSQDLIDKMARFLIVAERSAAHLRTLDFSSTKELWVQVQAAFQNDPMKYPVIMAPQDDTEGRKQFQMKCEAICFPPETEQPCCPEE